jgi:hypothetical protein
MRPCPVLLPESLSICNVAPSVPARFPAAGLSRALLSHPYCNTPQGKCQSFLHFSLHFSTTSNRRILMPCTGSGKKEAGPLRLVMSVKNIFVRYGHFYPN